MRDLALLMVKPDGVRQQLTGAVLRFLVPHGFTPLAATEVRLTPELRAELYATTRTGGRLDWELNAVLYTLGPVFAVLLRGPAGVDGVPDAAAALSGLKGNFLPTRARPDSLRGGLNAMNPIFNLVHTSDDQDELRREVPVLFGCAADRLLGGAPVVVDPRPGRPIDHWRVVGETITAFVDAGNGPRPGTDFAWPGPDVDRRAAFEAVRRARPDLLTAVRGVPAADGLAALIAGAEAARPTIDQFFDAAAALPEPPSRWHAYLTYTSLRYLDLCLENP
jgi:nucleoside diphosphate kinase